MSKDTGLLCVTRKIGESVLIGDNIRITIASIPGRQVRLAIEAPKDLKISRSEVNEAIRKIQERIDSGGD